jgi:hypothetical protein
MTLETIVSSLFISLHYKVDFKHFPLFINPTLLKGEVTPVNLPHSVNFVKFHLFPPHMNIFICDEIIMHKKQKVTQ